MYVARCTHRPAACTGTHVREHACTGTYRHTCATAYTHPYSHYSCTHMHGYMHPCTRAHTCMDAHKCVQLHIHAHTCTRMRCPSTHTEPSPQLLPCPCPDVCHPPPQQHRPPAPHAWPCPPRNAPGLLGWAPGPGSPPPQPVPVSWWPCVGWPQLSTQPLPSVLPPVRVGGCCGPPPATAQRDAGVNAGRERGFPSPCSHLPAPCLLCQGLAQPQLCLGHRFHMPL